MTRLDKRKSRLSIEFSDCCRERGKQREVVMDFTPYGIKVRLKGLRTSYEVSPAAVYVRAVRDYVEKARLERKSKRGRR